MFQRVKKIKNQRWKVIVLMKEERKEERMKLKLRKRVNQNLKDIKMDKKA